MSWYHCRLWTWFKFTEHVWWHNSRIYYFNEEWKLDTGFARSPCAVVPGGLMFTADVSSLSLSVRSPSSLSRSPWNFATWSKLLQFYNPGPKIRGPSTKTVLKTCKIWDDFRQLWTSIVNISRMDQDIENWKDMWSRAILLVFGKKVWWTLVH